MTQLWFRLEDVIPLAEHAMACTSHRPTKAQDLAQAPLRPALIWNSNGSHDWIESNGIPGWYTKHGVLHTAVASTWQHTATGRRGTVDLPRYRTAYIPLGHTEDQPGLAVAIRIARDYQRHWMWIDIDPTDAPGHVRVGFTTHRISLVPAGTIWTFATVTCDAVAGASYPALIAAGYTTDTGHLLARFDRATVENLIVDLDAIHDNPDRAHDPMPGQYPILRMLDDDVLAVYADYHDGFNTIVYETDEVCPDGDGHYSVGSYRWPWRLANSNWPT
ncbi:hypothetical protein [Virgisporangium aurantiacum]|uniref:Uncharacterized protein n=1 Tax=Virgisporangium aurantiacum TaxID=175570 RepID=A0A8J4E7U1_9ACTN|nr:hypothetical protein [Virgisporangium aurantiacum]GIJ64558.1 hypothetical protein Vau01_120740 [Virgisporangium aurantiacum]